MKRYIQLSGLALLTIFSFAFVAPMETKNPNEENIRQYDPCLMENNVFTDGEEIVYKLYYNWNFVWLSAGEVRFKVKELDGQYHLSAVGRTYKSYEWFFKVRDYYDTYINKNTLLPETSVVKLNEGKYKLYDKINFDQENNVAVSHRGKSEHDAVRREYPLDGCMHDILSIVYFSRNIDFENFDKGEKFPVKIFMNKKTYPLSVRYKGKEAQKRVKGKGKFKTIKFSPELITGEVFNEGDEMNIWVSDDKNRIPLLIESPVSVGSVKAILKSYKGLKYDMEAKVN